MKKFKNILSILVISIIIITVFLYPSINNKAKMKLDEERLIKNSIHQVKKIDLEGQYDLLKIQNDSMLFISWTKENQGKIYQLNTKKNKIEKYVSIRNNLIIGNYFRINKKEFLIINNSKNQLITVDANGRVKKINTLNIPIARVILVNDNFFFTTWENDLLMKFYEYNLKSRDLKQIQNKTFNDSKKNTGVLYDGILKQSDNKIALIPYATNEVLFFDSKFNFNDKLKLITHETDFKLTKMKNGDLMVDPNNLYPNINADIYNGNLYILTNESGVWDTKDKYYVDIYDIQKKKYLYSYYIDDTTIRPREIIVKDNLLHVLGKNKLNIYEIK